MRRRVAALFLSLVAVGVLPLSGHESGSAQQTQLRISDVAGVYTGSYTCSQGNTRLRLEIRSDDARLLTAIFTFYLPAGSSGATATHSFRLQGPLMANAETQLTPRAWETTPPTGWMMVGMTGRFDTAARTFSGRIQGPGCATFSVKLDPAQALTTRTPDQVGGQPSAPGSSTAPPATAASQPATASKGKPQTASSSVPAQAQPAAAQDASASQGKAHDPFAETKLNCETDEILRNFYDCECYTRRTVELLNTSGLVRPPEPIKDAFAAAALGKYGDAYRNAREEAAKTTSCISTSGISRWVQEQVKSLTHFGLEGKQISRDCAAEAVAEQYLKNPYPNYAYVTGLLREAAVACQR